MAVQKIHVIEGQVFPLFKLTWLTELKQITHAFYPTGTELVISTEPSPLILEDDACVQVFHAVWQCVHTIAQVFGYPRVCFFIPRLKN